MKHTPQDWIHHNLHTGRVSIRRATNRRTTHAAWVQVADDAHPHVSAKGRATMLAKGQRSVHAMIRGTIVRVGDGSPPALGRRITYNPFRSAHFTYSDDGSEWPGGPVIVTGGYAYLLGRSDDT